MVSVGQIDIEQANGHWYVETNIGEINLNFIEWQDLIEAHVNIGMIKLSIPEEPDAYSLHLETELGDIKFNNFSNDRTVNLGKSYIHHNETGPRLVAKNQIGNIEVDWQKNN